MKQTIMQAAMLFSLMLISMACSQKSSASLLSDEERKGILSAIDAIENRQAELNAIGTFDEMRPDEPDVESMKQASAIWHEFATLCRTKKYKEAYDFYGAGFNEIYFLIYLRHSSNL